MSLCLMYITNRPDIALIAQKYGVQRIWVDLETLGKRERQNGLNTVKSKHTVKDISRIRPHLTSSEMLVRVNPWNKDSVKEINDVIEAGADIIMLPMWKSVAEVSEFIDVIAGRCKTTLLLETKEAESCLDDVLSIPGVDEIHIGLNDLHLSYRLKFMFELLSNGTVERICKKIRAAGIPYGFGGIAQIASGAIPAEKIIMEHYRLGSTRVILSRGFCNSELITDLSEIDKIFCENIKKIRCYENIVKVTEPDKFIENMKQIKELVKIVVGNK